MTSLRQDPLTREWVIVAPERWRRPNALAAHAVQHPASSYDADCPFCAGNEAATPAAISVLPDPADGKPWSVRAVPNLYPIVSTGSGGGKPVGGETPVTGVHEVVIETPQHNLELPDREPAEVDLLLELIALRLHALQKSPALRYVSVFKNRGRDAGTSLEHPHWQVVALDFVPAEIAGRVRTARSHFRSTGRCLLCSIIEDERQQGARLVFESGGLLAFAPYASAYPGEAILAPVRHSPVFGPAGQTRELAAALIHLTGRLRDAFADPPYNLVLYSAPKRWQRDPAQHWFLRLIPRLSRRAGFELGAGVSVNPLAPEAAAALLRQGGG